MSCRWLRAAVVAALLGPMAAIAQITDERCRLDGAPFEGPIASAVDGRSGVVRCERIDDGRPTREQQYDEGRLVRQREWDDLGRRFEQQFHVNGAVRVRVREVPYHGRRAWDREDFWESGLLRTRGTYLDNGLPQGLVQGFHRAGPLASEAWYDEGRMLRRKQYAADGQLTLDEEFLPDGRLKSTMQRF